MPNKLLHFNNIVFIVRILIKKQRQKYTANEFKFKN